VATDGTIYVGSDDSNLYAINPDGSQKWKFTTGHNVFSSPAVGADGTIYVGSEDANLYAINPDGSQKWKFTTAGTVFSSPAVGADGSTIYIGSNSRDLYAVGPYAVLSPTNVSFGTTLVGIPSPARKVTLVNDQLVTLGISNITASGDFRVSSTTCGSSLAPLENCTISVTFTPTARGTRTGVLTVNDDGVNSPQTASLSGTGTAVFALSPPTRSFSYQLVGSTSPAQNFTLSNKAGVGVQISAITASGDFAVSSTSCGSSLGPLASCTISVVFKPTTIGTLNGTLTVKDNADNSPQTVSLSGTGTWITVSSASLSFGNQMVGTTSAARDVTFTNKGGSLIFISNITAGGDFAASSTTCGATLAAGASCSVSVTFTPSAMGLRSGTLTIDASAPVPTVGLSGTGIPSPTPSISSIPTVIQVGGSFTIIGENFTAGRK